jgi:8-oxo-dGTP pyrophosphatase MutT (NUDIX family)
MDDTQTLDISRANRAGCVVFNRLGEILVIEQFGRKEDEAALVLFPKGHLEAGETPEIAAAREAREEGGVEVGQLTFLGMTEHDRPYMIDPQKPVEDESNWATERVVTAWYSALALKRVGKGDRPNRWVSYAVAEEILTHAAYVDLIDHALGYEVVQEEEDAGDPESTPNAGS